MGLGLCICRKVREALRCFKSYSSDFKAIWHLIVLVYTFVSGGGGGGCGWFPFPLVTSVLMTNAEKKNSFSQALMS